MRVCQQANRIMPLVRESASRLLMSRVSLQAKHLVFSLD
jgi:hypothetical protein